MGAILNEIVPKASAGGTGGVSNKNSGWHGPSYYELNGTAPPGGSRGSQRSAMDKTGDFFGSLGNPFGMDQVTMNTLNQFGRRMDQEGFNPAAGLGVRRGQGNAFNPFQGMPGGGQGGGFDPLGLLGGGQQGGGFNPFSFLGGL